LIKKLEIIFALSILSLLTFCSKEDIETNIPKEPEQTEAQKDSILEAEQIAKHDIFPVK
jgi:hypothetical protein